MVYDWRRGKMRKRLLKIYTLMLERHGPQGWWPAQTAFECAVGAILTQNTAWRNVEKAVRNLKSAGALSVGAIDRMPLAKLARLIRPSGYFNLKAERLKCFTRFVTKNHGGDIGALLSSETGELRQSLLSVKGVGPETADSIALYAAGNRCLWLTPTQRESPQGTALRTGRQPTARCKACLRKTCRKTPPCSTSITP